MVVDNKKKSHSGRRRQINIKHHKYTIKTSIEEIKMKPLNANLTHEDVEEAWN